MAISGKNRHHVKESNRIQERMAMNLWHILYMEKLVDDSMWAGQLHVRYLGGVHCYCGSISQYMSNGFARYHS